MTAIGQRLEKEGAQGSLLGTPFEYSPLNLK